MLIQVVINVRHGIDSLFEKSGLIQAASLPHTPYIVFVPNDETGTVSVRVVSSTVDLLTAYPDDVAVMLQWPGRQRSDFFGFSVGHVRRFVESHSELQSIQEEVARCRTLIQESERLGSQNRNIPLPPQSNGYPEAIQRVE